MYLEHFQLQCIPFELAPNTHFYCQIAEQDNVLDQIRADIQEGVGFIKVTGEVGTGKTLLAQRLLETLNESDQCFSLHIANPDYTPFGLRTAIARELGIELPPDVQSHEIDKEIGEQLDNLFFSGQSVVLVIDEAQAMPDETLETLRLITNLKGEHDQTLQVVLIGQPELDRRLNEPHLRQLLQRIVTTYQLEPFKIEDIDDYLCQRMIKAGYPKGQAFTPKAQSLIYQASQGIPRVINILAHKALKEAAGQGESKVTHKSALKAINSSSAICSPVKQSRWPYLVAVTCYLVGVAGVLHYFDMIRLWHR